MTAPGNRYRAAGGCPGKRALSAAAGFTLIEILVALFIFGILVVTLFAAYRALVTDAEHLEKAMKFRQMGKTCLDRITEDLNGVYVTPAVRYKPPGPTGPADPYAVTAETESIGGDPFARMRFATTAHVGFEDPPKQGLGQVVYYVQETPSGDRVLRRADDLYPFEAFEENPEDPVLCRNVAFFELWFSGRDDGGQESDEWDSDAEAFDRRTPAAVRVRLGVKAGETVVVYETRIGLPVWR